MPAVFFINIHRRMVFTRAISALSFADIAKHAERLSAHPDFRPEFNQLLDFRNATNIDISPSEMDQLAETKLFSASAKRAMVVSSDFQFGMARMFASYSEIRGEPGIAIFKTMPEALSWLGITEEPNWANLIGQEEQVADN